MIASHRVSTLVGQRFHTALVVVVAVVAMWTAAAPRAEAVNGLTLFPRVGGPHAAFALQFVAPFQTYEGRRVGGRRLDAYYWFDVDVGPKACHYYGTSNGTHMYWQPGDRASIRLDPPEIGWHGGERWCPGVYVGHLNYERWTTSGERRVLVRRLASNIVFRVTRGDRTTRQRRPRLVFFPRVGGLRETFSASIIAPDRAGTLTHGRSAYYDFLARGPSPCREVDTGGLETPRGSRLLFDIDPWAIYTRSGDTRRRWCPGRYVGRIVYWVENRKGKVIRSRRVISNIVFEVRRLVLPWW